MSRYRVSFIAFQCTLLLLGIRVHCHAFEITLEGIREAIHADDENTGHALFEYICESEELDLDMLIPLLSEILIEDEDESVRGRAGGLLTCLGDPRAILPMTKALKDSSASVRMHAALALGNLAQHTIVYFI